LEHLGILVVVLVQLVILEQGLEFLILVDLDLFGHKHLMAQQLDQVVEVVLLQLLLHLVVMLLVEMAVLTEEVLGMWFVEVLVVLELLEPLGQVLLFLPMYQNQTSFLCLTRQI